MTRSLASIVLATALGCGATPAEAVTEPAPAPVAADTRTTWLADATPCALDTDCILVATECRLHPATRLHAADVAAANASLAPRHACSAQPPRAWLPFCDDHLCAMRPSEHPEWRACASDADCITIEDGYGWTVVASAHRADAAPPAMTCAERPLRPEPRCFAESCVEQIR